MKHDALRLLLHERKRLRRTRPLLSPFALGIVTVLVILLGLATRCGRPLGTVGTSEQPPQSDNNGSCTDVTDQVRIQASGEPEFVYSLDRTSGNRYVVGSSRGWNEQRARLMLIDGDSLALLGSVDVEAASVHARFDQWSGHVVALAETNNEVRLLRYQVVAGRNLELIDEHHLCVQCVTAWGGPETVEAYAGAAVSDLTADRIRVFVMSQNETQEIFESESVEGTSPQLVAAGADLSLLYVHDQQLWERSLDSSGGLAQPIWRTPVETPTAALLGASSYSDGIVGAAVLTASTTGPRLEFLVWIGNTSGIGGSASASIPAPNHPLKGSVTQSGGMVGFVWGQNQNQNQGEAGVYIAGGEPSPYQSSFGPYRVSDPVTQSPPDSAYSIHAATSYHNDGYAVVWGGWHEDTGYGIYGKIVSCHVNVSF